jgi:hypothetical protein
MTDGKLHHRTPRLTGQIFGVLTAVNPEHSDGKKRYWRFRCQCGNHCVKVGTEVRKEVKRGGMPNCGCATGRLIAKKNSTHGMSRHPAYAVWRSMVDRCTLPTHQAWTNYGGRGITVCEQWRLSFENFWRDMGGAYVRGLDLDRVDNNGPYSPQNCRWATRRTNTRNKRNSLNVDITEIHLRTGIPRSTLYYRLRNGLSLTSSTPVHANDS